MGMCKFTETDLRNMGLANIPTWDLITGPELSAMPYHTCKESVLVDVFFNRDETAPILMHLGKREMEKRGYYCLYSSDIEGRTMELIQKYGFLEVDLSQTDGITQHKQCVDPNEYIAFWSAVMEGLK